MNDLHPPVCPEGHLSSSLEILEYTPPHSITVVSGKLKREKFRHGEVVFRCTVCGYANGYSVPDYWRPPGWIER